MKTDDESITLHYGFKKYDRKTNFSDKAGRLSLSGLI